MGEPFQRRWERIVRLDKQTVGTFSTLIQKGKRKVCVKKKMRNFEA